MDAIHIPHLTHQPEQRITLEFDQLIEDLPSLTPVQGTVTVSHRGNYLEATTQATTIVTLCCDRCLQNYNHRLACDASEMLWLQDSELQLDQLPLGDDFAMDDVVEQLPENGDFDVQKWVYEQLCLALPQRKLCDPDCPGIDLPEPDPEDLLDRRWAVLKNLQSQLAEAEE
jgi:uncharacterized protein